MTDPLPPQREHGCEIENMPWPWDSIPRPWHLGQTTGEVPGGAPAALAALRVIAEQLSVVLEGLAAGSSVRGSGTKPAVNAQVQYSASGTGGTQNEFTPTFPPVSSTC